MIFSAKKHWNPARKHRNLFLLFFLKKNWIVNQNFQKKPLEPDAGVTENGENGRNPPNFVRDFEPWPHATDLARSQKSMTWHLANFTRSVPDSSFQDVILENG
jgi:hypothetical protein